ncbi:unnamed protein product [Linum tenue]|uniref:Cytochrome P450 n=1 Tax=Linum tenue TaxID=586396 RepID=A0AAV0L3D0_9ROSI|nr:unnamed protein product [Linum tenue]
MLTMGSKPAVAPVLAAMEEKYGHVLTVWLGMQRVLVVSDPKVVKECFTTHDRALSSRPRTSPAKFLLFDYVGFGVSPYGAYWRSIQNLAVTHLVSSNDI